MLCLLCMLDQYKPAKSEHMLVNGSAGLLIQILLVGFVLVGLCRKNVYNKW